MTNQAQSAAPPRRIVLTGFMGSGKTTVGPLLARRLGWRLHRCRRRDRSRSRSAPSPSSFARDGEAQPSAIASTPPSPACAANDALVLALGGGAIEHSATRSLLLTTPGTLLVHLEVELATTLARCRGTEHTPPHPRRPGQPRQPLPAPPPALPHRPRFHLRRCPHPGAGRGRDPPSRASVAN